MRSHIASRARLIRRFVPTDRCPHSQLVTNHLLHFLALDRSDAKKFQILQLISALLGWTDGTAPPFAAPTTLHR